MVVKSFLQGILSHVEQRRSHDRSLTPPGSSKKRLDAELTEQVRAGQISKESKKKLHDSGMCNHPHEVPLIPTSLTAPQTGP
jgi:hypothetical protein